MSFTRLFVYIVKELSFGIIPKIGRKAFTMKGFIITAAVIINLILWIWDYYHMSGTRVEEWDQARDEVHDRTVIRAIASIFIVAILCS